MVVAALSLCWVGVGGVCVDVGGGGAVTVRVPVALLTGKTILYYNEAFPVIAGNGNFSHICDRGGDFDDHRNNFSCE